MNAVALTAEDVACPICMERLKDPFVTPCGHSFCYTCIATHLQHRSVCPCCSAYLTTDAVFPNYLLSKVAAKAARAEIKRKGTLVEQLQEAIQSDEQMLKLTDLDRLVEALEEKRHNMQQREKENSLELLLHFLNHSRDSKTRQLQELHEELQILNKDILQVESRQSILPTPAFLPLPGITPPAWNGFESRPANPGLTVSPRGSLHLLVGPEVEVSNAGGRDTSSHPPPMMGRGQPPPRDYDQQWGVSGLFHANGQHLSNSALGMDLLAHSLHSQPSHQPPVSESHLGSSPLRATPSEPLPAASDDASVPQSATPQPNSSPVPISLSSDARQLSDSVHNLPSPAPPPPPAGTSRGQFAPPLQLPHAAGDSLSAALPAGSATQGQATASTHAMPELRSIRRRVSSEPSSDPTSHGTWTSEHTRSTSDVGEGLDAATRARKRRLEAQFEDLQQHYLRMRQRQLVKVKRSKSLEASGSAVAPAGTSAAATSSAARGGAAEERPGEPSAEREEAHAAAAAEAERREGGGVGPVETEDLREFSRMLAMFTQNSKLKVLAAIPGASQRASAAIISSIAFDKEARLFATAGVSKRISIFNFDDVVNSATDDGDREVPHAPLLELVSRSKLSCLSWNSLLAPQLISSDYEGVVALWDAQAGQPLTEYEAHDKRVWSVDYCPADPHTFASGSDDCFVKVWSTAQSRSMIEIDMKANVCCVKYHPDKGHEIAVGSADHQVHLFDLRNASRPVFVFPGHKKAVSYVRYMSNSELVSASTDSTLRSWNTLDFEPVRTYSGHVNEKNFVGLSLSGNFIACGSETSEVFVYYRSMSKPVARRLFSPLNAAAASSGSASSGRHNLQFISSITWKPNSQTLVAANSQGAIKAMQLTA